MMSLTAAAPLLLLGAGKMGGALLSGWIDGGLSPGDVIVVDPMPASEMAAFLRRHGIRHETAVPADIAPRVAVVAVKPQTMGAALPALAAVVGPSTLVVSIAAGTPIARFERDLGARAVVRAMPNTPAQVHRGVTVCVAGEGVTQEQRQTAGALMAAVGRVEWVDDEALIDAVTAVSGSGPAYIFLLAEAMAAAGEEVGLPPDLAFRLARDTVAGAGELLVRSGHDPETLRRNVTSPGGTTAAALAVLMAERGVPRLVRDAVRAAAARSRELSADG
jgi:pyrroline-5-carboxylate reductase